MKELENRIIQGDALEVLKTLPDESIDCAITSPPYWALRDYGTDGLIWDGDKDCKHQWLEHHKKPSGGKGSKGANVGANKNDTANMRDHDVVSNFCNNCNAWKGSFGLEPTFQLYIKHLCDIFDEVKRVLKKEGTCWVNIGDTYASGGGASRHKGYNDPKYPNGRTGEFEEPNTNPQKGATEKSLCQIPSRFAIEMTNRGWILRNEIIWHKPNCMPSSVEDRFTVDFEKIFFFVKSKRYNFEQQMEKATTWDNRAGGVIRNRELNYKGKYSAKKGFASGISDKNTLTLPSDIKNKRTVWSINTKGYNEAHFATYPEKLVEPMIKAGCPKDGIVLDIFMGSGTTAIVALQLDRKYLGIELNEEYIKIAQDRIKPYENKLF